MSATRFALCIMLFSSLQLAPQEPLGQTRPSDALVAALNPYNQTRAQPDDLTDADVLALQIGINYASRECIALKDFLHQPPENSKEIVVLGKLCNFGRQYQIAREALINYLQLPNPTERETALGELVRTYLGLNDPYSAGLQVHSLLRDYPYGVTSHNLVVQVIRANEGLSNDSHTQENVMASDLCDRELQVTMYLLQKGSALSDKDGTVSNYVLFSDALECAAVKRTLVDSTTQELMNKLETVADDEVRNHSAGDSEEITAFHQADAVGRATPVQMLHGFKLRSHSLFPSIEPLMEGRVIVLAFTLWSPSAQKILQDLAVLTGTNATVIAITSWAANTGADDVRSVSVEASLRQFCHTLPANVPVMLVSDQILHSFNVSAYPTGIAFDHGKVVWNAPLVSEGSIRMMILAGHIVAVR